jgi:hypothetical protein
VLLGNGRQASFNRERDVPRRSEEIEYLQFAFFELTLAVCSRVRRDGTVEIEIGPGDPKLPSRTFTAVQIWQAMAAARARDEAARRGRLARAH